MLSDASEVSAGAGPWFPRGPSAASFDFRRRPEIDSTKDTQSGHDNNTALKKIK